MISNEIETTTMTFLQRIETKIKLYTFTVMHELIQAQVCSPFLYKLLLVVETIQLLYYSLHPNLTFLWQSNLLDYIRQIIQYLQVNSILQMGDLTIFQLMLYLSFVAQTFILTLLILIIGKMTNPNVKASNFLTYGIKLLSTYGLLLNTIFSLPFYNIFIAVIYCNSDSQIHKNINCYQGMYYIHFICAILGIIFLIILTLFFTILFIDLNPNGEIPFAAPQNYQPQLKLFLKFILPLYVTLDFKGDLIQVYILLLCFYHFIIIVSRYRTAESYNYQIYTLQIVCEILLFWITLCGAITAFIQTESIETIGIFYAFLGIPLTSVVMIMMIDQRNQRFITMTSFKKDQDLEIYLNIIIRCIVNYDDSLSRIYLEGILKFHAKQCYQESCSCNKLASENPVKDEDLNTATRKWFIFLNDLVGEYFLYFPKSARLHLILAFIQHDKLRNKFKALYELMKAEDCKPNIQEEFSIYRYKILIQQEMKENDAKFIQNKGIDVNIVVYFQKKLVTFLKKIEETVDFYIEFWSELLEENPDIIKLQNSGSNITQCLEEVRLIFKQLLELNENNIFCLELYANFLNDVVNDDVESQSIFNKIKFINKTTDVNKQFVDKERQKYSENSDACIISCSGNFNNVGIVTSCNKQIQRILGFHYSELVDINISKIMPKYMADVHDLFIKNYLETSKEKVINEMGRVVFCQNKLGYIVPCSLLIKIMPNLDNGISMVGFLQDISEAFQSSNMTDQQQNYYIIYNVFTEQILGISQNCYQYFGISHSLVYGNPLNSGDFTINSIIHELTNSKTNEELKQQRIQGIHSEIDTVFMQNNMLLNQNESDIDDDNSLLHEAKDTDTAKLKEPSKGSMGLINNQKEKFRKSKIRIYLIEEQDQKEFNNNKINIIKFNEFEEQEEILNNIKNKQKRQLMKIQKRQEEKRQQQILEDKRLELQQQLNEQKQTQIQEENANENRSVDESMVSAAQQEFDNQRYLKEFKILINEKAVPQTIINLQRTIFISFLVFVTLAIIQLVYSMLNISDVQNGVTGMSNSYMRHNMMADINYKSRKIWTLINNYSKETMLDNAPNLQIQLLNLVNQLQSNQFEVVKSQIIVQNQNYQLENDTYDIKFMSNGFYIQIYKYKFYDAVFQYINSANYLQNASLSWFLVGFNETLDETYNSYRESTMKFFYYLRENGLFVIRQGSEQIAENLFNFYHDNIYKHQQKYELIMILGIIFYIISQMILIPIILRVYKTNNQVVSLFGIIPDDEIKNLALKCQMFMDKFLIEQKKIQINQSDDGQNLKQNEEENFEINNEQLNEPQIGNNISGIEKPENNLVPPTKPEKQNQQKQHDDEQEDYLNQRAERLLNQNNNSKTFLLPGFTLSAVKFVGFFVINYLLSVFFLQNIDLCFNHYKYMIMRPSLIKYNVLFTLEEIVTGEGSFIIAFSRVYLLPLAVINSYFPSLTMKVYVTIRTIFVLNQIKFKKKENLQNLNCKQVSAGLLDKGLRTSVVSLIESTRDILSRFQNTQKTLKDKQQVLKDISYITLDELCYFIVPSIQGLNDLFFQNMNEYILSFKQIEEIKFSIFIILVFLSSQFVWLPFIKSLNVKIWKTKGMLNMIPVEIIKKHEKLKTVFTKGEILQSVK